MPNIESRCSGKMIPIMPKIARLGGSFDSIKLRADTLMKIDMKNMETIGIKRKSLKRFRLIFTVSGSLVWSRVPIAQNHPKNMVIYKNIMTGMMVGSFFKKAIGIVTAWIPNGIPNMGDKICQFFTVRNLFIVCWVEVFVQIYRI